MKLGVHIGYWGLGLTREDQLEIVQEAERLGYDSVWTAEAYGSDAATILGWIAGQTTKIKIGSAIFQMPGRSPAMTAMTAARLDPDARLARAPARAARVARGGRVAGRTVTRRVRHRPDGQRVHHRQRRGRARRGPAVPGALRRRHGLARQELLQRARAALRLRGRGARGAGPLPRGQARRGDGGAARRADRPGLAGRPEGPRARAPARVRGRGRRDAGHH